VFRLFLTLEKMGQTDNRTLLYSYAVDRTRIMLLLCPPAIGALSDTAFCLPVSPSVCPSPRRTVALGCRHAGCLQLSHVQTADPSVDGPRSAASRTAVGRGHIVSSPGDDN